MFLIHKNIRNILNESVAKTNFEKLGVVLVHKKEEHLLAVSAFNDDHLASGPSEILMHELCINFASAK